MVKEKPDSTRIYDDEGFRKRAACLCVKNEESEILLVSSSRHKEQWIVPGGGVEPEESTLVAAVREVVEEAGVVGKIDRCLGIFEVSGNKERRHRTSVYVLRVTEELSEWKEARDMGRKRKWFPIDEALKLLAANKPVHLSYLQHLRRERKDEEGPITASENSTPVVVTSSNCTDSPAATSSDSTGTTT